MIVVWQEGEREKSRVKEKLLRSIQLLNDQRLFFFLLFFIIKSPEITDTYRLVIGDESCSTRKRLTIPCFYLHLLLFLTRPIRSIKHKGKKENRHKAFCTPLLWRLLIGFNAFYIESRSELWILYEKGTFFWIDFLLKLFLFFSLRLLLLWLFWLLAFFKSVCLLDMLLKMKEYIFSFVPLSLSCSFTRQCLE